MTNITTRDHSTTFTVLLPNETSLFSGPETPEVQALMATGMSENDAVCKQVAINRVSLKLLASRSAEVNFCQERKLDYTLWFTDDEFDPMFMIELRDKAEAAFFAATFVKKQAA